MKRIRDKEKVKKYRKTFYDKHKKQIYQEVRARKIELRLWFQELKHSKGCSRCPENHPFCLDYHHRNPKDKLFEVSKAVAEGYGRTTILKEMKKCKLLCANCHRKLHYKWRKK